MTEIELGKELGWSIHDIIQAKLSYAKSLCVIDTPYLSPTEKKLRDKKYYEERETIYLSSRVFWSNRVRGLDGWRREYCLHYYRENEIELEKIRRRLNFYFMDKKKLKSIDIKRVKEVPISDLYNLTSAGFFVINPLREEKSPSNSLHYNKTKNTWKDFGSGEGGDLIDMVMKDKKCSFKEACSIILAHCQ